MNFLIQGQSKDGYKVATEVYQGPLDLLLELIERSELDITRVALAQVTDQYLAYLANIQHLDAAEVSAFLVVAAKLVQIKSEALLPRPPERESGEEDPGEVLAKQLILYRRYKHAAIWLQAREESGLRTYLRVAPPPKVEGKVDLSDITIFDLAQAAREVFSGTHPAPILDEVVSIPKVTILDKINVILRDLKKRGHTSFLTILGPARSRLETVVTFLALLELVKRHIIEVWQEGLFADIQFKPTGEWNEGEVLDLEEE